LIGKMPITFKRKPGQQRVHREVIGRRHRAQLRQQPEREQRQQHQRIEVAVVVGGDDRRAVSGRRSRWRTLRPSTISASGRAIRAKKSET
jgi:hypothetical protein